MKALSALVAAVALLAMIVLVDSATQWYGYLVLKRPFTNTEVIVMGGGSAARAHPTACSGAQFPISGCC